MQSTTCNTHLQSHFHFESHRSQSKSACQYCSTTGQSIPFQLASSSQQVNMGPFMYNPSQFCWNSYPSSWNYDSYPSSWNYGLPPVFAPTGGPNPPPSLSANYGRYVPPFACPCTSPSRFLFWVCKLNNRITTCFGCKFMRAADGSIPVPPFDLILKCTDSREYCDKDGNKRRREMPIGTTIRTPATS